ncbi:MAG: hypothetical protein Q8R28_15220 [Dehalococcoidia bacterium]|nr:hypothetical protein [Dehalococcoidia bacterium]
MTSIEDWGIRTWLLHSYAWPAVVLRMYPMSRHLGHNYAALWRYGSEHPVRWRKRTPMDIDAEVRKWHESLVGYFTSHTHGDMDKWDFKLDELMSVVLAAPVAQLREFARQLAAALAADPRVPLWIWEPMAKLGDKITGAPDEEVIQLKVALAERIARMVEHEVTPQIFEAIANALKWRDEDTLAKVETALKEGKKPRLKGRESCLFLCVGEGEEEVMVML